MARSGRPCRLYRARTRAMPTDTASSSCAWIRRVDSIPPCARSFGRSWPPRCPSPSTSRRAAPGGERRHLYHLCGRHRRHGARHQPRRGHPHPVGNAAIAPPGGRSRRRGTRRTRRTRKSASRQRRRGVHTRTGRLHGRNAEWAAEAVRGAASLPALEAQKLQVIDVIANDVPDLLRKIDGRTAIVAGKPSAWQPRNWKS